MKKNIALVTLDYPPETGGVARYLGSLVRHANGEMDVFVNETHPAEGPGKVEPVWMFSRGPITWQPMIGLMRLLKKRGYQHVLVSHVLPVGTAAWIARMLGGLKYSVIVHGLDLRLARMSSKKTWLTKQVLRRAHTVIANSEAVAKEIRQLDPSLQPEVLTPGVEAFHATLQSEARQKLQIREGDKLVISIGRLVSRKGFDQLIEAIALLSADIKLVIIGRGNDENRLRGLAKNNKERVRFVTDADDEQRNMWLSAADVFALPARDEGADVEGFGIVYLEAAAHGLACIGGNSGGVPEAILNGKTGMLVDPNHAGEIANAIQTLFEDPNRRIAMGRLGRERVRAEFRWETRTERLLALLK